MGRIQANLGNGLFGDVEIDPFTQILNSQISVFQQVRVDTPSVFDNTFEYIGIANTTALTSDNTWGIVRKTWMNNRITRYQYLGGVSWDNRITLPWPL